MTPFLSVGYVPQDLCRRFVNHLNAGEIWKIPDLLGQRAIGPLYNLLKALGIGAVTHEANFTIRRRRKNEDGTFPSQNEDFVQGFLEFFGTPFSATIVAFFGRSILLVLWCSAFAAVARYADVAVWWIKGLVTKRPLKMHPTWSDVNDSIASVDRTAVLQLLHHRYGDR